MLPVQHAQFIVPQFRPDRANRFEGLLLIAGKWHKPGLFPTGTGTGRIELPFAHLSEQIANLTQLLRGGTDVEPVVILVDVDHRRTAPFEGTGKQPDHRVLGNQRIELLQGKYRKIGFGWLQLFECIPDHRLLPIVGHDDQMIATRLVR
jgi:hypothetical protein